MTSRSCNQVPLVSRAALLGIWHQMILHWNKTGSQLFSFKQLFTRVALLKPVGAAWHRGFYCSQYVCLKLQVAFIWPERKTIVGSNLGLYRKKKSQKIKAEKMLLFQSIVNIDWILILIFNITYCTLKTFGWWPFWPSRAIWSKKKKGGEHSCKNQ